MSGERTNGRLLVFDCHEAWVYQLRALDQPMDVIVDLPGRLTPGWDTAMRPIPPNARCVRLKEALARGEIYDCIIAHNLTDLLDVKTLEGPRLLMIHQSLGSMIADQGAATTPNELRQAVSHYVRITGTHVTAVTRMKGESWGFAEDVVAASAECNDYPPYRGDLPRGLRVANQIGAKRRTLLWDLHERAFAGLPVTLVGRNPDLPDVAPARDWDGLKRIFSRHRFFIHTADPAFEDGYNMATLEAMAAGLPVLGNRHPTSPVIHGVSGFLSDDAEELKAYAQKLIAEPELAAEMGREAQKTVAAMFGVEKFKRGIENSIRAAREKWLARQVSEVLHHR